MKCTCGSLTLVTDSRLDPDNLRYRIRKCPKCANTFSTKEVPTDEIARLRELESRARYLPKLITIRNEVRKYKQSLRDVKRQLSGLRKPKNPKPKVVKPIPYKGAEDEPDNFHHYEGK